MLKFITCGSVDDGKSTLIGHMLYDAKLLFADQQRALELDSRVGSAGGGIDYSLLLDGLMAEREQGITIDVAYRYFSTEKRSFIVADTPGHEEYTRNMAVGASFADLSVILMDATHGVMPQTRRHARICALMGIRHFVIAVNKMDLIHYDSRRFQKIQKEIRMLMSEFDYDSLYVIPVSATEGDNITSASSHMPWFRGNALLPYLESIEIHSHVDTPGALLPVQRVCRPDRTFRGFQGQIAHGTLKVGDQIQALPSGTEAVITKILWGDREVSQASAGEPVTVQLDREIDISRSDAIVRDYKPCIGSMLAVNLLWMDDVPLTKGKSYLIKLGTESVPAVVMNIRYKTDINTGAEVSAETIYKNEIAFCEISTGTPLIFDSFSISRELGSFILIDRVTNSTAACGTVEYDLGQDKNLTWQKTDITPTLRENHLGQKALTFWMTGLSGSGKSAIANALEKKLFSMGRHTMLLDGDNIRMGLCKDLGFGSADRIENIRRIAEVAKLMNDAGLIVLTSFISPHRQERRNAGEIIGDRYIEIYVSTPLEECERRDIKGLYKAAREGKIRNFTGISSPYEIPEHPALSIDTTGRTAEDCAGEILEKLKDRLS